MTSTMSLSWVSYSALVAQTVKNPPAMWETWAWSLGWEGPLDGGGHANHSSILAWRIPWTEEPVGYSPWSQSIVHDWATNTQHTQLFINTEQSIYIFRLLF